MNRQPLTDLTHYTAALLQAEHRRLTALTEPNPAQAATLKQITGELDTRQQRIEAAKLSAAWDSYFFD